jgi:hypothetical protein
MTRRKPIEWPELAVNLEPEEARALEEVAERLSDTPAPPSRRFRSELTERFASVLPAPRWRPENPATTAALLVLLGVILLALAAIGLAGAGPFSA